MERRLRVEREDKFPNEIVMRTIQVPEEVIVERWGRHTEALQREGIQRLQGREES